MPMSDWKGTVDSERTQIGIALLFCTLLLGGFVFFFPPHNDTPAKTAVATTTIPDTYAHVQLAAKAAIVFDLATGKPLYVRNADAQLPLASLTKLLTTYAATDALSSDTPITITDHAISMDGDSGLTAGESFAFDDIARFALVASSNDAAEAIIEAAANHRIENTETLLRNAAAAAGLAETYAINGTGLDESESISGGYGSARDIARLAGALLAKAPDIARATTESSVSVNSLAGVLHTQPNTDIEVARFPNLLLSKTGFTDLAGGNLVIVFDAGISHPVAVAVLGSTRDARFTDVDALVAATLAHFAANPIPVTAQSAGTTADNS
jgi:D-alanyl-D-alanine carboxypeptidase